MRALIKLLMATFVGGKYSLKACAKKRGNEVVSVITGDTTDRLCVLNDIVSAVTSIIRTNVVTDYGTDPVVTPVNADSLFFDEAGTVTGPAGLANTINFFLNGQTGTMEVDGITRIVESYFYPLRTFVRRFYDYDSLAGDGCVKGETPGAETCVKQCDSSITMTFVEV